MHFLVLGNKQVGSLEHTKFDEGVDAIAIAQIELSSIVDRETRGFRIELISVKVAFYLR